MTNDLSFTSSFHFYGNGECDYDNLMKKVAKYLWFI